MITFKDAAKRLNGTQKVFALVLLGGVVYGVARVLNGVIPTINELLKNIWLLVAYGVPLGLVATYVVSNPTVVWGFFKTLSWKLTKWMIKQDPLSVMDRYIDYLQIKLNNLNKIKVVLAGKKTKLERLMTDLQSRITDNLKKGNAALKQNQNQIASLAGVKVATDKQTLALYQPIYAKMSANCAFLEELSENWTFSIEKLGYTVERKREEYLSLREMAKALNVAKEFARGDTNESKIYNESVKALEESVSQKLASIEDFEKNTKGLIGSIRVEKQMISDEGLSAIEEYRRGGELLLPDFSKGVTDLAYETVKPKNSESGKFNHL